MISKQEIQKRVQGDFLLKKGKSLPIGTVRGDYKKFGEGDWRKVKKDSKKSKKKEPKMRTATEKDFKPGTTIIDREGNEFRLVKKEYSDQTWWTAIRGGDYRFGEPVGRLFNSKEAKFYKVKE